MTNIKIVIGGNFGDEGKGLMTSFFAAQMMKQSGRCLVVLSNGGAQRGHTVVKEGVRHVFRHFGSGTLEGADTWFPEEFILNPMIFMKEYHELHAKIELLNNTAPHNKLVLPGIPVPQNMPELPGIPAPPDKTRLPGTTRTIQIFAHPACRITTPFEMITNLILEENRGSARHGSVGVGIWETMIGEGKRFGEFADMNPDQRFRYLNENRKQHMFKRLEEEKILRLPDKWAAVVNNEELIHHYLEDFDDMLSLLTISDETILSSCPEIIFENGQGLLLDSRMFRKGYGHHTTPSFTGIHNPADILRKIRAGESTPPPAVEAVYVTRSYMTRHGAGRFDTECPAGRIGPALFDRTNLPNESQGTIRYGSLNMQSLLRRVKRDFKELEELSGIKGSCAVAMTHLNEFQGPGLRSRAIKYTSYTEEGPERVILVKNETR